VILATGAALLIAVPFFLVMPRLGSPWIAGSSFGRTTGFSPNVDLGKLGRVTQSQEVALVMRSPDGSEISQDRTRLRGTAFDQVMAGSWLPRRSDLEPAETARGMVWVHPEYRSLDNAMELEIDMLRPRRYLMLPPGVVAIQADTALAFDPYGGVTFRYRRGRPLSYRVWVEDGRSQRSAPPSTRDILLPSDHTEVRELARSVAGNFVTAEARATAIERFLQQNFRYSLQSGIRIQTEDPVAWFLLEGGEGHCEFFAGAMVVMLRHLQTPARMVAGYVGGDMAPGGEELVVREANAHAWVEVWLGPESGWVVFDPTPPAGIPGLGNVTGFERLRWTWQQLELLWDRRLLTFGLGEQIDLVDGAITAAHRVGELLRRRSVIIGGAMIAVVAVLLLVVWRWWQRRVRPWRTMPRRNRGPAGRLVVRLARALIPVGGVVPPSATVRTIGEQAASFWPQSASPIRELVRHAEAELYGEAVVQMADPAEARRLWKRIRVGMKENELTVDG
jgi:transglutaminase-like putative cysteine protease